MGHPESDFFDQKLSELSRTITEDGKDELGYPIVFHPDRLSFEVDRSLLYGLTLMGDVAGKTILDCGCGSGFASIYLAKKGATVWAFDLSQEAVNVTRKRASLNGLSRRLFAIRSSLHDLPFPDASFDGIFGSFILHHTELPPAAGEIRRVLKRGKKAVFVENSSRNPILMFARRNLVGRLWIPKKGTADEHPLTPEEVAFLKSRFRVTLHYADFVFFRMTDYLLPSRLTQRLGVCVDRGLYRLVPWIRPYSYYQICELTEKP